MTKTIPKIKDFWLITNYSCNNRCKMCYTDPMGFDPKKMPFVYAKDAIKAMKECGAVKCTLIGGEPTLYSHIVELIRCGKSLGLTMKIVTNGRRLSDPKYLDKLLKAGLDIIAVSIHGSNEETHNEITRSKSFRQTIAGIKNCLKNGVDVITLTTISALNREDLVEIACLLDSVGAKNIVFNIAAPYSKTQSNKNIMSPKEIARTAENLFSVLQSKDITASVYATVPLCLYRPKILNKMLKTNFLVPLNKGGCNVFDRSGLAFDPYGSIIPCTHRVKEVLEESMDKNDRFIFKDNLEKLQQKLKCSDIFDWRYPSPKCNKCFHRAKCIGGCPLFWLKYQPNDFIPGFVNKTVIN